MKGMHVLAGTLTSLALSVCGWAADVRTINYSQILERPPGQTFTQFARNVAIDGADLIVLATHDGGQSALLYHRASGGYRFTYSSTLLTFEARDRMQVRMKNGIAVIQFGDREWIFERSGGRYVPGVAASPLNHPGGVAISGNSILFGGDNCGYDGVIYQKGTDGRWTITGRLDDNQGSCVPEGLAVELNYDTALIHSPGTPEVTTWRRSGTALDWVTAGALQVPAAVAATSGPFALQNSTVVTPGSYVFRREGNTWTAQGRAIPADYGMGSGNARAVKYRDGVLVTSENWLPEPGQAGVYVYLETTPGCFEHVAILPAYSGTYLQVTDHDVSGRTVVMGISGSGGNVLTFTLPEPLAAPDPIVTDFEDGDASDFSAVSGQFAIAARGSNHVLAQTNTTNFSVALAQDSDAAYLQRVEAKITPAYGSTDGWVGLIARYTDANNYYYVAVRKNGTTGLYRRRNGVNELLRDLPGGPAGQIVRLIASADEVQVSVNNQYRASVRDTSLPRGRAGLITYHAGADFDDVVITATNQVWLIYKRFTPDSDVGVTRRGREFNTIGGDWQYRETNPPYIEGYLQRDASRSAFAFVGAPVRNQEIETAFSIDAVSSATGAWVGLLGRYVDSQTHYFATVGTNGRVEIRKRVNGVVTLLGFASRAVNVGDVFIMRFRLVGDQLQLFLGDRQVLSVRDDDIPAGAHGLATNRAAATWTYLYVKQP